MCSYMQYMHGFIRDRLQTRFTVGVQPVAGLLLPVVLTVGVQAEAGLLVPVVLTVGVQPVSRVS